VPSLSVALSIWDAIIVPVHVCFLGISSNSMFLLACGIAADAFYVARLLLRFRVSFADDESQVTYAPRMIARNYLSGEFLYDVVAIWPYNFIVLAVGWQYTGIAATLRLFRLLNLKYVRRAFAAWLKTRPDGDLVSGHPVSRSPGVCCPSLRVCVESVRILAWGGLGGQGSAPKLVSACT